MAENSPLPEVPECSIERHGDGFKVVHESGRRALPVSGCASWPT
jgi:hypothetical protein